HQTPRFSRTPLTPPPRSPLFPYTTLFRSIPVIGMGGISTAADIVEFMLAGATAVEIGTASFWDPVATEKIAGELERWCADHDILDRKSTRLNSSHRTISYAVFCLKKKINN